MPTTIPFKQLYLALFLLVFSNKLSNAQNWQKEILKKSILYQSVNHQEKIYVQTDRPSYFAGEDIWFSAFIINVGNQKLNTTEKVLYIELITPGGSSLQKNLVKIENGKAWGNIPTNEKLSPGNYHLVAYTNWMRNAGSEFFFSKQITIATDNDDIEIDSVQLSATEVPETEISPETDEITKNLSIKFYPEGGHMIQGVNCKVAFEVLDESGSSVKASGLIFDDQGEIIAPANTLWKGKGFFMLTPQAEREYFIQLESPGYKTTRIVLPAVKPDGLTLAIQDKPQENQIQVNVLKAGELPENNNVFLLSIQNGMPKTALKIDLSDRQSVAINIDKSEFVSGIVQFTLFDSTKIPQAERLFHIKNPDRLTLQIKEENLPDSARKKAELILEVIDQNGNPVSGNFAVSVTDAKRVPEALYHSSDIFQYLTLVSDLPDEQINDTNLFENSTLGNIKSELLMLTNGWRRYNWENVLKDSVSIPEYFEEPGIYVHGTVRTPNRKAKIPKNTTISMYTKGKQMELFSEELHEDGAFTFVLKDYEETQRTILQTKNKMNILKDYNVEIHTNYNKKPTDKYRHLKTRNTADTAKKHFLENEILPIERSVITKQISRKMLADSFLKNTDYYIPEIVIEGKQNKTSKEKITDSYGSPDFSIGRDKIAQLCQEKPWYGGLFDLLTDAFPNLEITASGRFRIKGKKPHRMFILVDGVLVNASDENGKLYPGFGIYSIEDLLSLEPKLVTSVDLVYPKNSIGYASLLHSAELYTHKMDEDISDLESLVEESERITTPIVVLSIYTKDGTGLYSKIHFKGISNLTIHGYTQAKEFYSPDYSTKVMDSIYNDYRNTLAWYPNITTDTRGKAPLTFFASDVSKNFRVEVNGISNNGNLGSLVYKSPDNLFDSQAKKITTNYIIENENKQEIKPYIILHDSSVAANTYVRNRKANWSTYTSPHGVFFIDNQKICDTTQIEINKPGYQDIFVSYLELVQKKIVLDSVQHTETDITVKEVIKRFHRKKFQNHKHRNGYYNGAYREQLFNGQELHQVTDLGFTQQWPSLAEPNLRITTQINGGRLYQSNDIEKAIPIRPHTRSADGVQIIDPVYENLSFLNQAIDKEYIFKLVGQVNYQGRKMYHISFDQNDNATWAFYQGELYIDAETYGLAYASWKISKKGFDYLMPDEYLSAGGDQKTFKVLEEHNEISRHFNGKIWQPVFAISKVTFSQKGAQYTIIRELVWQSIPDKVKNYKIRSIEDMEQAFKLTKTPKYNPWTWRTGWLLPPIKEIDEQLRYLNNVVEYKPPKKQGFIEMLTE